MVKNLSESKGQIADEKLKPVRKVERIKPNISSVDFDSEEEVLLEE